MVHWPWLIAAAFGGYVVLTAAFHFIGKWIGPIDGS